MPVNDSFAANSGRSLTLVLQMNLWSKTSLPNEISASREVGEE
jgi:hypothetical protein